MNVIETDIANKGGGGVVLEYLQERLFDRIVDKGNFSERDAADYYVTGKSLVSLTKRIMHRDLKPENIMPLPSPDADPVIVDFGFAKIGNEVMPDGSAILRIQMLLHLLVRMVTSHQSLTSVAFTAPRVIFGHWDVLLILSLLVSPPLIAKISS